MMEVCSNIMIITIIMYRMNCKRGCVSALGTRQARQRSRLRTDEEESEAGLDAAALGARLHVRRGPARALLVLHAPAHTLPPAMLPALHHLLHYWQVCT